VKLWVDLETYSPVPINHGTHAYAAQAEVMLFAWAIDDEPVDVWDLTTGAPMPPRLRAALDDGNVEVWAHSYGFEKTLLRATGIADIVQHRWRCTMAQALRYGLPGGLEKLCAIFRLPVDQAKDRDGHRLVMLFCVPRPKNMKLRRATAQTHPDDWVRFVDYCALDVEAMRVVARKLPTWNESATEQTIFNLDGVINDRGVLMDVAFARAAVAAIDVEQKRLAARTGELTDDEVESTTQVAALLEHLVEHYDLKLPDMRAATVERALEVAGLPPEVAELLLIRSQASKTSSKKYAVALQSTGADGRLRAVLQYCGAARTGRWAGRLFQPQNLPRPTLKQDAIDDGIQALLRGIAPLVFDNVMELASSAIRGLVIAPPGRKLVVSDLANIEGRMLAWLAGEEWKLKAFREFDAGTGPDLYRLIYSRSFNVPLESVTDDHRQIGKVQELALGYQGAAGAFGSMAALYRVVLPEDEVQRIVAAWRRANARVSSFWYEVENAARAATLNPGEEFAAGRLVFDRVKAWLRCRLPSGRYLSYASPVVDTDTGKLTFMGVNPYTKVFERLGTYGGKLVENATQAAARDVLAGALPRVDYHGYNVVLTVHDELITEAPDTDAFDHEKLSALLAQGEDWTTDLPLAARGFETYRYRKN
jgi:DNA polymerase